MPIESLPQINKPNLPQYPVDTLNWFSQLTRDEYEKRYGMQPPLFDANQPPKLWFDTSPNAGNYTRLSINADMSCSFIPMTMTPELAAKVNLPGAYRYPKYVAAATSAEFVLTAGDGSQVRQAIPPGQLASFDQARTLAVELGGTTEEDPGWPSVGTFRIDWKTETRRMYNVQVNGMVFNAGYLLEQKNANGIGAPGAWESSSDSLRWAPRAQITAPLDSSVKAVPVPVRVLDSDEEIVTVFGNIPVVRRKGTLTATAGSDPNSAEVLRLMRLLLTRFSIAY